MLNKKILGTILVATALVFSVSCSSKKKKGEGGDGLSPTVSSQDISFDPAGSDSGNIAGLSTVNFEYDRASLSSSARKSLAENATWINANKNVTVQIEGHCDSRGSVEYNLALGERRAKSVKTYLISLGVPAKRLSIISYGKEKPVVQGDTEQAFGQNRRANFVPLPN